MFGVGPFELLLIVVVVIVIYGPKQLPEVMKQAARFIVQARRYSNDMRGQFNDVIRQVKKDLAQEELEKLRKELRDVTPKIDLMGTNSTHTPATTTPAAHPDAHHTLNDHSPDHGGGMSHPPGTDPMYGGVPSGGHNPNDQRALFVEHRDPTPEPAHHEPTAHQPTVAPEAPITASPSHPASPAHLAHTPSPMSHEPKPIDPGTKPQ